MEHSMGHQLCEDAFASSISSSMEAELVFSQSALGSPLRAALEFGAGELSAAAPTGKASATSSGGSHGKLGHNAYERDRRKQLNGFYSALRGLLPDADQSKKLSIPSMLSRVLKYIPELQKQVGNLQRKKEDLLVANSRQGCEHSCESMSSPAVSATYLNNKEVMVHISFLEKNHEGTRLPLSKYLRILEGEGLRLVNASTFATSADRTFYNLHLQQRTDGITRAGPEFCENLVKVIKERARVDSIRR